MKIHRYWCMPNKLTFSMPPLHALLKRICKPNLIIVDPFANNSKFATITNDLNPDTSADYHMDALDFLKTIESNSVDIVLYDPPYSPRQVSECYKEFGYSVTALDTSAHWRKAHLDEIARIVKIGGKCVSCGWNTNGVGKKRGFEIEQILDLAHGGSHNDTLITIEQKIK